MKYKEMGMGIIYAVDGISNLNNRLFFRPYTEDRQRSYIYPLEKGEGEG